MSQNLAAQTLVKAGGGAGFAPGDKRGLPLVAQAHAANFEAVATGNVGICANSAGVTTSVALATTYLGICLSNPAGSGKNLSLMRVTAQLNVAPAAITSFGLIVGYSAAGVVTHTTALTPLNALIGGGNTLVGLVDSACTIVGTPAWGRWIGVPASPTGEIGVDENVAGELLIPPGGYVAVGTLIASPASGFLGSFTWEEISQ